MKIGIKFYDVDYTSTLKGVLKMILMMLYRTNPEVTLTKEILHKVINESLYSSYLLFQARFDEESDDIKKYLCIPIKDIFIDSEVDMEIRIINNSYQVIF